MNLYEDPRESQIIFLRIKALRFLFYSIQPGFCFCFIPFEIGSLSFCLFVCLFVFFFFFFFFLGRFNEPRRDCEPCCPIRLSFPIKQAGAEGHVSHKPNFLSITQNKLSISPSNKLPHLFLSLFYFFVSDGHHRQCERGHGQEPKHGDGDGDGA